VVTRISLLPDDLQDAVEKFFYLPYGPDGDDMQPEDTPEGQNTFSLPTTTPKDRSPENCDEFTEETRSVVTTTSLDENGVPKKKKKRILKGMKKRVSNILGVSKKKENLGVDFSGMDSSQGLPPQRPPTLRSTVSGTSSVLSDGATGEGNTNNEIHRVQPGKLLKIRITRGSEKSRGNSEYEVSMIYNFIIFDIYGLEDMFRICLFI
jgi:hypothetical protein